MRQFLTIAILPLLLFGCKLPQSVSNKSPNEGKPGGLVGSLSNASIVEIKNDWNGYSDITPIVRHYRFNKTAAGLDGNGNFAVGGHGGYNIRQDYSKKITIPPALTDQFFQKLAESPLTISRKYKPKFVRRDDFPYISIYVKMPDREVTFTSKSQGDHNAPWQVRVKKNKVTEYYVTNSPLPGVALDLIKPQIDHPGLDIAINKMRNPAPLKAASKPN
jgi:hypothetical protein